MYKITLPINLDGYRYGIKFFKGVGETDDEMIAERMRTKGFAVESIYTYEDVPKRKTKKSDDPAPESEG